jgi:RNA polymerase sigma factor (sigma-70 family)
MTEGSADEFRTNAARAGVFATTRWSLVLNATEPDAAESASALAALCESYWRPLYAYIRRRGHNPHDAQDLTQEFFAFLLSRNHFAKADPDRGRFRSFLLGSLKKFLSDQRAKANALKRGGDKTVLSLDFDSAERTLALESPTDAAPDKAFDRGWTLALLERTMSKLRREHETAGKAELFDSLKPAITGDGLTGSYGELAVELDLTEGAIKMAVMRMRRRYGELLRAEIAETVSTPGEIDDEVRGLFGSLRE